MDQKVSLLTTIPAVDRTADFLYIVDTSAGTPNKVTPNSLLGITGAPVGTTDTQTLSAKTLTSPTINGVTFSGTLSGTYTIGGTPTFPASVVTLTGSQILTNKILTSPTINTATIVNPTLTTDTVSEFTSSNGVTISGLNIKSGKLNTNNSVVTNNVTDAAITPPKWTNPYKFGAYQSALQLNLVANTWTKIELQTEEFDTNSNFANTVTWRYTVPVSGFYQFNASVAFNVGANGVLYMCALYKNGTELKRGTQAYGNPTQSDSVVSSHIQLAASDYIELFGFCGSGVTVLNGQTQTYLNGFLVSIT